MLVKRANVALNRSHGTELQRDSFARICKSLFFFHVVALKDKLIAKWEGNGLIFRQYVYTSCVVVLFLITRSFT